MIVKFIARGMNGSIISFFPLTSGFTDLSDGIIHRTRKERHSSRPCGIYWTFLHQSDCWL